MNSFRTALILTALSLSGCASYDGRYEPGCIAYEGDTIVLEKGRFEWRRFTDERRRDAAGNVVTPFPGFPKSGTYRVSAGRLELVTDDDVRLDDWFVVEKAGRRYLLNAVEHAASLEGGSLPDCALALVAAEPR